MSKLMDVLLIVGNFLMICICVMAWIDVVFFKNHDGLNDFAFYLTFGAAIFGWVKSIVDGVESLSWKLRKGGN